MRNVLLGVASPTNVNRPRYGRKTMILDLLDRHAVR
jgi:hypothetical protein